MKVNINDEQKIVTGIFKYQLGIQYTKGDFVIDNDTIYYVNADINGDEGLASDKYTEYTLINAIKDSSELDMTYGNKLVTSNVLKSIINEYVNGLNYGGYVSKIVASQSNSLDKIQTTCIRCIEVPIGTDFSSCGLPELLDPTESYTLLFRSFKLVTDRTYIAQELIDFNKGIIYTRSFSLTDRRIGTSWDTFYSLNYSGDGLGVNTILDSLRNTYSELRSIFNEVNRYVMVELYNSTISTSKECHLSALKMTNVKLLDIIVKYRLSNDTPFVQDTFRVNLSMGDQTIERTIYGVKLVTDPLTGDLDVNILYQGSSTVDENIHFDKIIGIKYL